MLNFCILNSDYLLRTFELKSLLFQKVRLIIFKTINKNTFVQKWALKNGQAQSRNNFEI